MLNTLNLGLKSSLLMATVVSGAIVTTSAYFLGEYQYFNTVVNQINNYMSPVVALFPKAQQGFNSLTSKSVDWSKQAASTTKEYVVLLSSKAIDSDTWTKGSVALVKFTLKTLEQQLNMDSIFEFLKENVFNKEKILSVISEIHGNIIPNLSKVLSSLSSLIISLSTGALSLSSVQNLIGEALKGKSVVEVLKTQVQDLANQLQKAVFSEDARKTLQNKAQELLNDLDEKVKSIVNQVIGLINKTN